jgi:hypothetical protein
MQMTGDDAAAEAVAEQLGVVRPPGRAILDARKDVASDVEPRHRTALQLKTSTN